MRDTEQKPAWDEENVEITDLPEGVEAPSPQNGAATTSRLARRWRYIFVGGAILLVLAIIFGGLVSMRNQGPQPSSRSKAGPVAEQAGATETATPISSTVSNEHYVNTRVVDGVTYAATTDLAVYALRTSDGSLLWRHKINGEADIAPVVVDGIVYVTAAINQGPGTLYALRANDGSEIWHHTASGYVYDPTVSNGVVYMGTPEGIVALGANDGTQLWLYSIKDGALYYYGAPEVVDGIVYVNVNTNGSPGPGAVYALRIADGTVAWHYASSQPVTLPTISNGIAYIVSDDGTLSALRASDGQKLWHHPLEGNTFQQVQIGEGVIYVAATQITYETSSASNTGSSPLTSMLGDVLRVNSWLLPAKESIPQKMGVSSLYALRVSDGTLLWHFQINGGKGISWVNWFSVDSGVVYAAFYGGKNVNENDSYIYALRSDSGSVLWSNVTHNNSPMSALIVNSVLYVSLNTGSNGSVRALRVRDGSQVWNYTVGAPVFTSPQLVGTTLYFGAANGIAFALHAENGTVRWHYQTDVSGT